jgi:hypothetical protein
MTSHLISRRTIFHMPKVTKGATWMSDDELLEAIGALEAYEAHDRNESAVKEHRLAGLYAEVDQRGRVGR